MNMIRKFVRFLLALTIFPWLFMMCVGCIVLAMDWILDPIEEYPNERNKTKYSDTLRRMQKIFDTWVLWFTFDDGKVEKV